MTSPCCHSNCQTTTVYTLGSPTCFTETALQLSFGVGVLSGAAAGAAAGSVVALAGLIASGPAIIITAIPTLGAAVFTGTAVGSSVGFGVGIQALCLLTPFGLIADIFSLPFKALAARTVTVYTCPLESACTQANAA